MKMLINKELNIVKWHNLLLRSIFSSPFQSPEYYDFFNSVKGFSADVFAIEDDDEYKSLVVVTIQKERGIKSFFSRRGIIYGGPLVLDNGQNHLPYLFKEIKGYYKSKLIYLETRNSFNYSFFKDSLINIGYKYFPYLNYKIKLENSSGLLQNFKAEKRRQIKKAITNGGEISIAKNEKHVEELYDILKDIYNSRAKKPIPSKDFFIKLYNVFRKSDLGVFILILNNKKVIGGSVCPIFDGIIYDWYRGGNDKEYKHLYPSTLAAYAGMKVGLDKGLSEFDFMGAGLKDEYYGVRGFKSQFGGKLVEHGRFVNIFNPVLYKVGQLGLKVLSKIK